MYQNGNKLSILVGGVAAAVLLGGCVYSFWKSVSVKRENMTVEATGTLVRDIRRFHDRNGSFPETLRQLDGTIWQRKPRNFTDNGLGLYSRKYFYLYRRVSDHHFSIWAVPFGPRQDEAPIIFIFASRDRDRRWMGPSYQTSDKLELITKIPSMRVLYKLGLYEQPTVRVR